MASGRNLVVLADGTGNSAAKAFKTNVWRLYEALDLNGADQIAVFSDGVGTSSFKPFQIIGLALGFGVKRRVLALYKFLCLNYRPGEKDSPKDTGDQIHAFGFSRGAYTIRVLVGLIDQEGLVHFNSHEELDRNALAAYRAFRKKAFPAKEGWTFWIPLSRFLRDKTIYLWNKFTGSPQYEEVRPGANDPRAAGRVRIRFLGVWDTVAAYGLPIDELTRAVDRWIWPMSFSETYLLDSVDYGRQAFSIDDERRTFFPIPWNEDKEADLQATDGRPRLRQAWFTGAHANVGGGYPDDRLSYIPLCWMVGEARDAGLRFDAEIVADYWDQASESGRRYDSRSGFGVFYRYHPRSAKELMNPPSGGKQRSRKRLPLVDASAIIRMAKGSDRYGPIALPKDINVLTPYDEIVDLNDLGKRPSITAPSGRRDKLPLPPGRERDLDAMQQTLIEAARQIVLARGSDRGERVELMQDSVWWGRVLYYVTLLFFVLAGLYPLLAGSLSNARTANLETGIQGLIEPLAALLKGFLPGLAAPWLQAVSSNPLGAILLGLAIGICLWIGGFLRIRIQDRARAVWNIDSREDITNSAETRYTEQRRFLSNATIVLVLGSVLAFFGPPEWTRYVTIASAVLFAAAALCTWKIIGLMRSKGKDPAGSIPPALRFARRIRKNDFARGVYQGLKNTWLPMVFLVLSSALILLAANKATFEVANSIGKICPAPSAETGTMKSSFKTIDACTDTGIQVDQGLTYSVTISIDQPWFDGSKTCADVLGVKPNPDFWVSTVHASATLMKRWWSEPYFRPIARIGQFGNDEYVLAPVKPLKATDGCLNKTLTAHITPRRSGRLYVYVNDAILGLPWLYDHFYGHNNEGTATITVDPVD